MTATTAVPHPPSGPEGPLVRAARALALSLLVGGLLFFLCGVHALSLATLSWLETWGSTIVFAIAGALCWARVALVPIERGAWSAFAMAATAWTGANLYFALGLVGSPPPLVSLADAGYLVFPLLYMAGLLRCAHVRVTRAPRSAWLDALIVSLGAAALVAALAFAGVTVRGGSFGSLVDTVIYPVEDILVLGTLVGIISLSGRRMGAHGGLLAVAIFVITAADVLNLSDALMGSAYGGAWPNLGWVAGIALVAGAAWWEPWSAPRRTASRPSDARMVTVPLLGGLVALGVLAVEQPIGLDPVSCGLALAALAVVLARFVLTVRDVAALADARRLAFTDDLTGLANRRRLVADLGQACAGGDEHVLTIFDLDGFKQFNDTHGHTAGDELLAALAARLAGSLPGAGRAYRLGGDEFCVLVAGETHAWSPASSAEALSDEGPDWSVAASWGSAGIPAEATQPTRALRLADARMYEQKRRRPGAARQQVRDALLLALSEQQPELGRHSNEVTDLVAEVARRLGMEADEVDDAVRAAELHDIGKLAIPAEILNKPGPLEPDEWEVIRTHTVVGERVLLAAPALSSVAPLVRASHERFDGSGYPDGLAGEAIPLGARIVTACDAFDAITSDRPYRAARSIEEALDELERCAGTHFDPRVVRVLIAAVNHAG